MSSSIRHLICVRFTRTLAGRNVESATAEKSLLAWEHMETAESAWLFRDGKFDDAFKTPRIERVTAAASEFSRSETEKESYACFRRQRACTLGWISDRKFASLLFSARIFGLAPARQILRDFQAEVTKLPGHLERKIRHGCSIKRVGRRRLGEALGGELQGQSDLSAMCPLLCVSIGIAAQLSNEIFPKVILPKSAPAN
jgi:hypothetical protein